MAVTAEAAPRTSGIQETRRRVVDALYAPTDIAFLVYFRGLFGTLIAWHAVRDIVQHHLNATLHSTMLFTYWPFTFVKLAPTPVMYGFDVMLVVAGVFMAVGFYYRLSAVAIFVGISYFFLLDEGQYLNHI